MSETMAQGRTITTTDKKKMEERLWHLKNVDKVKNIEEIAEARGHGDLSENAEYDAARAEQGKIEGEIRDLEEQLATATVIDDSISTSDVVALGTVVTVYDTEYDEEDEYTIVGFTESDPLKLFISADSPIGGALMGARVGDEVNVAAPQGTIKLVVRAIRRRDV